MIKPPTATAPALRKRGAAAESSRGAERMVEPGCPTAGNLAAIQDDCKPTLFSAGDHEAARGELGTNSWWRNSEDSRKCFWMPPDINYSEFPGTGERPARLAYVASRISTTLYDDFRDYVPIHGQTIKSVISSKCWKAARDYFDPMWEVDPFYKKGERSKGYRWVKSLRGKQCPVVEVYCPNFSNRLEQIKKRHEDGYGFMQRELLRVLSTVETTISDPGWIEQLKAKPGVKDANHRRAVIEHNIHCLRNQDFGIITQDEQGRVHYGLTRTNREVRDTLTISGHETVEVDLANSQPFFLCVLFREIPHLASSVASGHFYEDINAHLDRPYDLDDRVYQYPNFKRLVLMMLYRRPKGRLENFEWWKNTSSRMYEVMQAAECAFPGLNLAIESYSA